MTPLTPLIPAVLSTFCGLAFLWRFYFRRDRNFLYIGRAFGYFILTSYYIWALFNADSPDLVFWARWSITVFLFINALYFVQEMITVWRSKKP